MESGSSRYLFYVLKFQLNIMKIMSYNPSPGPHPGKVSVAGLTLWWNLASAGLGQRPAAWVTLRTRATCPNRRRQAVGLMPFLRLPCGTAKMSSCWRGAIAMSTPDEPASAASGVRREIWPQIGTELPMPALDTPDNLPRRRVGAGVG